MNKLTGMGVLLALGLFTRSAAAGPLHGPPPLEKINRHLAGHVVDHTNNHGTDRRIWSDALGHRRALYVYLPPGYDPQQRYPLMFWLHGFAQDEQSFLTQAVPLLDRAIACGKLPPVIVAAPDGSLDGSPCLMPTGSFFINSKAGRFEDFLMVDVWNFVHEHYPIRPEREAHVLAGVSMGGGGAYNLAIKYRDRCKIVVGLMPPLNLRWIDCRGRYLRNFDPCCWGWRTSVNRGHEIVGRFYGVVLIRLKQLTDPLYGRGPMAIDAVIRENPAEMLDAYNLQEGELSMYVAYGGKDQFNIDAQVESFLYLAKQRGLTVTVGYEPDGKHDLETAAKFIPALVEWLRPQLAPYSPPCK